MSQNTIKSCCYNHFRKSKQCRSIRDIKRNVEVDKSLQVGIFINSIRLIQTYPNLLKTSHNYVQCHGHLFTFYPNNNVNDYIFTWYSLVRLFCVGIHKTWKNVSGTVRSLWLNLQRIGIHFDWSKRVYELLHCSYASCALELLLTTIIILDIKARAKCTHPHTSIYTEYTNNIHIEHVRGKINHKTYSYELQFIATKSVNDSNEYLSSASTGIVWTWLLHWISQ